MEKDKMQWFTLYGNSFFGMRIYIGKWLYGATMLSLGVATGAIATISSVFNWSFGSDRVAKTVSVLLLQTMGPGFEPHCADAFIIVVSY